jgi:hypothetical protein
MSKFVLTFRSPKNRTLDSAGEAAWGDWFQTIGASIADAGNRVGEASPIGNCGTDTALGGYMLVNADDLEAAVKLAKGCPGLRQGGGVEIGSIVDMT